MKTLVSNLKFINKIATFPVMSKFCFDGVAHNFHKGSRSSILHGAIASTRH